MKFDVRHLFAGLMILTLTAAVALAKDHSKTKTESITFFSDVTVDGTTVKAGTYDLKFDEQTGALEIRRGSKVVAKTTAHVEKRSEKARGTEVHTTTNGSEAELTSIAFGGKDENIVVGGQASPSTSGQD
jgi:Protein of unknown function (DUF2911)